MASLWMRVLLIAQVFACAAATSIRLPKHLSSRTPDLTVTPENNVTSLSLPEPYIWHTAGMVSTWTFRDFRGSVPLEACQGAWDVIEQLAAKKISQGKGDSSVTLWPLMWKETMEFSREDHGQWFGVTILASWRLTWRMLEEALDVRSSLDGPKGAYLACESKKEFRFEIVAAGKAVASGSIHRKRGGSSTEKQTPKLISSRDQEMKPAFNATKASPSNITVGDRVHDPYIWHIPGMLSTWEFHSFRGRVNTLDAQQNWLEIGHLGRQKVASGRGSSSIQSAFRRGRPLVYSWEDDETHTWTITTIYSTAQFTYRVLSESSAVIDQWPPIMFGSTLACERSQEFEFDVFIESERVGWGSTRTRARHPDTAVS
ncbi:MAG: hypothetical protein Q9212_003734 [Teloschistes hypoglaucus]